MYDLHLSPEELEWLSRENVYLEIENFNPQMNSTIQDTISESSPAKVHVPMSKKPKLDFPSKALIGEVSAVAISLCKGNKFVNVNDPITVVRNNKSVQTKRNWTPKKLNNECVVRLKNTRTMSEFARLTKETSSFISTLLDLEMCSIGAELIYVPDNLKISDEIVVSVKIYMNKMAFDLKLGNDLDINDQVWKRKKALAFLFQRTGLIAMNESLESKSSQLLQNIDPDKITSNELANIYSKANQIDKIIEMATPPDQFKLKLQDYQKVGLAFMLSKENRTLDTSTISPLWMEMKTIDGYKFYYSPYSGELSLEYPVEFHCQGGILADEMGLGKTIQALSLICANQRPLNGHVNVTLLICSLNLLSQWTDEIKRCFDPKAVRVFEYYGSYRSNLLSFDQSTLNIVISTYGTLTSEFKSNKENSPIFQNTWQRVILDEAHYIKDKSTQMAKACFTIKATYRWALTGTPIVNKLEDLFSIIHFLKVEPWCKFSFWNSFVSIPFQKRDPNALEIVQTILEPLVLRRTKDMKDVDGNAIVDLPPKYIEVMELEFSNEERKMYNSISVYSKRKLNELKSIGKADYLHVFSLITNMRQACNHHMLLKSNNSKGGLFTKDLQELMMEHCVDGDNDFKSTAFANIKQSTDRECPICFEPCANGVVLPCLHLLCKSCLQDLVERAESKEEELECPICCKPCKESQVMQILMEKETADSGEQSKVILTSLNFSLSTKLKALMSKIDLIETDFPQEKIIIFSQWTSMLDIIELPLQENRIAFSRLDGSMSKNSRDQSIKSFKEDSSKKVLLASLRSCGVGLNLTVASRVIMFDPWWNFAVENQAIDRVHRLGQQRPVHVYRFIIKDSVEQKMLAIQERKSRIAGALTEDQGTNLQELMSLLN